MSRVTSRHAPVNVSIPPNTNPSTVCLLFSTDTYIEIAWPLVQHEAQWQAIAPQRHAMLQRLNHRAASCLPRRRYQTGGAQ
jgi:hypothetical protein